VKVSFRVRVNEVLLTRTLQALGRGTVSFDPEA
jgi:hypothetical protein